MAKGVDVQKFVIFGTGSGGKKVFDYIANFKTVQVQCFLDNFPKAEKFCELPVIRANDFLSEGNAKEYIYIIASTYRDEITKQLLYSKIPSKNIWSKADIVCYNWIQYKESITISNISQNEKEKIVLDCGGGFILGGVERWSYNLSRKMLGCGRDVLLISNKSNTFPPEDLVNYSKHAKIVDDFWNYDFGYVQEMVDILMDNLPCTVFAAHVNVLLIAASLIKERYPEAIKVVSVVHGGLHSILRDNVAMADYVDYILCVSVDARKALVCQYHVDEKKVLFKETPTEVVDIIDRTYHTKSEHPLRIAYATRLEKTHKHAELVMPLVEELEKRKMIYVLDIAGEGSLYENINEYITQHNLQNKVRLLGRVPYHEMTKFWMSHDVAINLSECEGCAMAMVESMAVGTVPIFTNVFSTKHFIHDGVNGYVTDYGNITQMADKLEYLDKNRNVLPSMGNAAWKEIRTKCQMDDYYTYLNDCVLGGYDE